MGLFDLFRRKKRIFEPGEPIKVNRGMRAHVWDLFIERVAKNTLKVNAPRNPATIALDQLPRDFGRYRIRRASEREIVVVILRAPDECFLGHHPEWASFEGSPLTPLEFTGVAINGPHAVSFCAALSTEGFAVRPAANFVVSGYFCFTARQLRALGEDPHRASHLVIENCGTDVTQRASIQSIADTYEYEVIGINRSPAPEPRWAAPPDTPGFVSTGGWFNTPLALYVHDPQGAPYELRVHAECGEHRSETITIRIED